METASRTERIVIRIRIRNWNISMKNHTFDGTDLIYVFKFFTGFLHETETLHISKEQYFVSLPTFLPNKAETKFRPVLSVGSRHGGIMCWSEAVKYFLRMYETPKEMKNGIENRRCFSQLHYELEGE